MNEKVGRRVPARLVGLPPDEPVTLRLRTTTPQVQRWEKEA